MHAFVYAPSEWLGNIFMTQGDCYILSSNFHKLDIGFIFLGQTKGDYIFTPLFFKNNKFDEQSSTIFDGKIKAKSIPSGLEGDKVTGIFTVYESKKRPSFLTEYCNQNNPFINLNLDSSNIILGQNSTDLKQIIIGGMTTLPGTKESFDKYDIQGLIHNNFNDTDLMLILKNVA